MRDADEELEALLGPLGLAVRPDDVVLDLGCGDGRLTLPLARRAAHVIALEPSRETLRRAQEGAEGLENVTWLLGDGESLTGVQDAALDAAVAGNLLRRLPDAKATLGYVTELGRVLRPGGWAALAVSTEPRVAEPAPERRGTSRRDLFRGLAGRPRAAAGAPVPLYALGAVATAAGLSLEQIEGSGTALTLVRAVRG